MSFSHSSSSSTCSSTSYSSSSLREFLNHVLHSILHPFTTPMPARSTGQPQSTPQDLLTLQQAMNANLSLFEKTYVSFPELTDQDNSNVQHPPQSSSITC